MTVAERINCYPPVLCRLLARHHRRQGCRYLTRAMTAQEIAKAAGLKVAQVESLSTLTLWDAIPVGVMFDFARACGVDFNDQVAIRRQQDVLRKSSGQMSHWKDDPRLARLVQIWVGMPSTV